MSSLGELRLDDLLAAVGARTPAPASGAAVAVTAALAAALAELAARYAGDEEAVGRAGELGAELLRLADEDAAAYAAFMASRSDEDRARTIAVPERIAAAADEAAGLAERVTARLSASVAGDAEACRELAGSAARAARRLAELNRGG